MGVGQGSLNAALSYLAIGRETVLGTYTTCTAQLDFLSSSLKTTKDSKLIEQIETNRVYSKRLSLGKVIAGDVEFYYLPQNLAANYILQQAFGGAIASVTATGDTVGSGVMEHTIGIGTMENSYTSLCINHRKGQITSGKVFQYNGLRVNELTISAEIDDALKMNAGMIGIDSTTGGGDVSTALTATTADVLSFVRGRVSVEGSVGSLTSTSFWSVQNFELTLSNSLKADNDSRRIGSDLLQVLPAGIATIAFKVGMRFDTTTAFDAMLAGTQLAAELEFQGATLPGSNLRETFKIQLNKIYVKEAGDPEIGGPDEMLMSEVSFDVLRDNSSVTGYAIQAVVRNKQTSYA